MAARAEGWACSEPAPHPRLVAQIPSVKLALQVPFFLFDDAAPDNRHGLRKEEGGPQGVGEAGDPSLHHRERQVPWVARETERATGDEDFGGFVEPERRTGPPYASTELQREHRLAAEEQRTEDPCGARRQESPGAHRVERQAHRQPAEVDKRRGH